MNYKIINIIIIIFFILSFFIVGEASTILVSSYVSYDNANGLNSTNIQDALDEIVGKISTNNPNSQPKIVRLGAYRASANGRAMITFDVHDWNWIRWKNAAGSEFTCYTDDVYSSSMVGINNGSKAKDTWHDISGCTFISMQVIATGTSSTSSTVTMTDLEFSKSTTSP